MITAVTLNPCIDRTVFIDRLIPGGHNVAVQTRVDVCGKGVNVNAVLRELGIASRCLALEHEDGGAALRERVSAMGVEMTGIAVPGALRLNIKLTEPESMTEINEKGAAVPEGTEELVLTALESCLDDTDVLVLSGSIPPGMNADIYRRMIEKAREHGVRSVLDASGERLRQGIKARPWLIKPNLLELEELTGERTDTAERAAELCRELNKNGVELVCLSMGERGAMLSTAEECYYAPALTLDIKGFQGAGDSMVAGICYGTAKGMSTGELLRCAVAAASASLEREGTLLCTRGGFEKMLAGTEIIKL